MSEPARSSSALALALLAVDGVGRVTAGRIVTRFPSLAAIGATPREQVLLRLRGLPRADELVAQLFDGRMETRLAEAEESLDALASRGVSVLTEHHPHWPPGLAALERADRPVLLYAFGDTGVLCRPVVALLARPPLDGPAFETSQALVRRLLDADLVPAAGLQHGFDTVVYKLAAGAGQASVMVATSGLARVPPPMRSIAAQAVRAGGVMISPFPMDHGPFTHDDGERARLLVALSAAAAFFNAREDSAEARALTWALEHDHPVFGAADPEGPPLPERVHLLAAERDLDWVIAAARAGRKA
jgi:DNA processing protein